MPETVQNRVKFSCSSSLDPDPGKSVSGSETFNEQCIGYLDAEDPLMVPGLHRTESGSRKERIRIQERADPDSKHLTGSAYYLDTEVSPDGAGLAVSRVRLAQHHTTYTKMHKLNFLVPVPTVTDKDKIKE